MLKARERMTTIGSGAARTARRDLVHRMPGCWYIQDSRMLPYRR
jgi:hypothetical protein